MIKRRNSYAIGLMKHCVNVSWDWVSGERRHFSRHEIHGIEMGGIYWKEASLFSNERTYDLVVRAGNVKVVVVRGTRCYYH